MPASRQPIAALEVRETGKPSSVRETGTLQASLPQSERQVPYRQAFFSQRDRYPTGKPSSVRETGTLNQLDCVCSITFVVGSLQSELAWSECSIPISSFPSTLTPDPDTSEYFVLDKGLEGLAEVYFSTLHAFTSMRRSELAE